MRGRVVNFLAGLLGKLIQKFVGPKYTPPLSRAIVDAGLRILQLETTSEDESKAASSAVAATVEETIQRVAAAPDYILDDQELLEGYTLEAFEQAAAANLPPVLSEEIYRKRPSLAEARKLRGIWLMMPYGRRKRYKKFSRKIPIRLVPYKLTSLETFEGVSLEGFLEEQLGTQAAYAHPKATNGSANPLSGVLGISFRVAWWLLAGISLFYLIWIGIDGWQLGHMNPDEALQQVYMRLRRQTHRVNGIPPMGQTAREFAAALEARISMLSNANPMIRWLAVPISNGVPALTELYMQSLFASVALSDKDSRRAIRVWLAVRWRLGLMNLALALCHLRPRIADVPSNAAHAKVS